MSGVQQYLDHAVLAYYGLPEAPIVTDFILHNKMFPTSETPAGVDSATSFGVEVELEKCVMQEINIPLWNMEGDGSLKDAGMEFISRPIRGSQFGKAFQELEYIFQINNQSIFSHRCSIHVHMGVNDLTVEQLIVLISAYVASEKLFFNFVGGEAKRHNNAYCFPIVGSGANIHLLDKKTICSGDSLKKFKYCGMNFYHLRDYGTLEFRHHPGTKDIDSLRAWMNAIASLYTYAEKTPLRQHIRNLEEVSMTKNYSGFISDAFGEALPGAEYLTRSETRLMILAAKHFISDLF